MSSFRPTILMSLTSTATSNPITPARIPSDIVAHSAIASSSTSRSSLPSRVLYPRLPAEEA